MGGGVALETGVGVVALVAAELFAGLADLGGVWVEVVLAQAGAVGEASVQAGGALGAVLGAQALVAELQNIYAFLAGLVGGVQVLAVVLAHANVVLQFEPRDALGADILGLAFAAADPAFQACAVVWVVTTIAHAVLPVVDEVVVLIADARRVGAIDIVLGFRADLTSCLVLTGIASPDAGCANAEIVEEAGAAHTFAPFLDEALRLVASDAGGGVLALETPINAVFAGVLSIQEGPCLAHTLAVSVVDNEAIVTITLAASGAVGAAQTPDDAGEAVLVLVQVTGFLALVTLVS